MTNIDAGMSAIIRDLTEFELEQAYSTLSIMLSQVLIPEHSSFDDAMEFVREALRDL